MGWIVAAYIAGALTVIGALWAILLIGPREDAPD